MKEVIYNTLVVEAVDPKCGKFIFRSRMIMV